MFDKNIVHVVQRKHTIAYKFVQTLKVFIKSMNFYVFKLKHRYLFKTYVDKLLLSLIF